MPVGFEVSDVWKSRGRGFQLGIMQGDGIVIHLTGQVVWSVSEGIMGNGDVEAQTRQCFENIKRLLEKVDGEIPDIVSITTYFTKRAQLPSIQKIRTEYLKTGQEPVSTSVMVAGLGHEDFLVELTPVAVIPKSWFVTLWSLYANRSCRGCCGLCDRCFDGNL